MRKVREIDVQEEDNKMTIMTERKIHFSQRGISVLFQTTWERIQSFDWFDSMIFTANLKILSSLSRSAWQLAIKKNSVLLRWGQWSERYGGQKDGERGTEQPEFNQLLEEPSEKPFIIDTAKLQSIYNFLWPYFQYR